MNAGRTLLRNQTAAAVEQLPGDPASNHTAAARASVRAGREAAGGCMSGDARLILKLTRKHLLTWIARSSSTQHCCWQQAARRIFRGFFRPPARTARFASAAALRHSLLLFRPENREFSRQQPARRTASRPSLRNTRIHASAFFYGEKPRGFGFSIQGNEGPDG